MIDQKDHGTVVVVGRAVQLTAAFYCAGGIKARSVKKVVSVFFWHSRLNPSFVYLVPVEPTARDQSNFRTRWPTESIQATKENFLKRTEHLAANKEGP